MLPVNTKILNLALVDEISCQLCFGYSLVKKALASTILNEEGFNPDVIEKQLAHIDSNSVRRAYNRAEYIEDRNKMMQWWSDFIVEQCPTFIETKQATLNL